MKKSLTLFGLLGVAVAGLGLSLSAADAVQIDKTYTPAANSYPEAGKLFRPSGYQKGENRGEAWYEVRMIPGRQQPVLHLHHHGVSAPQKWANFFGVLNAATTLVKAEFELSLAEAGEKRPQFTFSVCLRKPGKEERAFSWVSFSTTGIAYFNNGKKIFVPCDLGKGFHAFTLTTDAVKGEFQLFRKGQAKPLFTGKLTASKAKHSSCSWGDGTAEAFGAVDIAYVKISAK